MLSIGNTAALAHWDRVMAERDDNTGDLVEQLSRAIAGCQMSLNQLAKATGVHRAQLSRFVRAERSLSLKAAAKLCAYLGLRLTGPILENE